MKNIYEDGNDRSNMQDIGSGQSSLADSEPEKPAEPKMQNASPFTANAQNNAAGTTPVPQLSPEQIVSLFGQFLAQFAANSQPAAPPPQQQSQPQAAPQANDTGKRILFQSDDFDEKPDISDSRHLLPEAPVDEQRRKSFYDDDELFDLAGTEPPEEKSGSAVKTTDFGSNFSIAEVELDSSELPELPQLRSVPKAAAKPAAPPVIKPAAKKMPETDTQDIPFSPDRRTPKGAPFAPPKVNTANQGAQSQLHSPSQPQPASQTAQPPFPVQPSFSVGSFTATDIEETEEKPASPKKKKNSTSDIIRKIVLAISLAAIVIASGVLIREYKLHKDNEALEAEISNLIITEAETETTKKSSNKSTIEKQETTAALTIEQQWEQIRQEYPNVAFPPNLQLKYAKLYATNQDFVGYLSADGINLSLPVVQTQDDETYLSKNFYGQSTKYGCPFVTHLNNIETLDMNTIIFGHHMNDGTVFGALDKYKTIDGFKAAPVITFNTLYNDYKWKIIAAFITNIDPEDDNGYVFKYYFTSLSTEDRYAAYLNELAQRSLYDTGVDVLPTDKILTLSTCSHEFEDARFVVVARLVRQGESESVDTSRAVVNSNPRYPQAYYDKMKLTNPFANAARWEVG